MALRTSAVSPRALVLAAAIPILFIHVRYQPGVAVGFGSTSAEAYLSDFAVLAVVLAALASGVRDGFAPLLRGRALWAAGIAFFVWVGFEVVWGRTRTADYSWQTHGVTAAKFFEYALLAPAVPLLVRTLRDLVVALWSLVLWSAVATGVGVAEFFGASIFFARTVGHRQGSFLGESDFAALSGGAALAGAVALAAPRLGVGRRLGVVGAVAGAVGIVVAGSIASVLGIATALVVLGIVLVVRRDVSMRRIAATATVGLVVVAGAAAIRSTDLTSFAHFLGASSTQPRQAHVQTYAHRTLLVWIGWQIAKHHPLLGVGWEGSAEPANFMPYIRAAHRRFPDEAPLAFPAPAPKRRYGVQSAWVQALADLGVVGLVLFAAIFASAAAIAARGLRRLRLPAPGLIGLVLVALLVWLWAAQGFYAGIPLDALTWLGFGIAATEVVRE